MRLVTSSPRQEETKMRCTNVLNLTAIEHSCQLMEDDAILYVSIKVLYQHVNPVAMAVENRTPPTKRLHYTNEHVNATRTGKYVIFSY